MVHGPRPLARLRQVGFNRDVKLGFGRPTLAHLIHLHACAAAFIAARLTHLEHLTQHDVGRLQLWDAQRHRAETADLVPSGDRAALPRE